MKPWEVGLSTGCFYRRSIKESLGAIIRSGFRLLEISSSPAHIDIRNRAELREVRSVLDDHGVEVCSLHAPFAEEIDITSTDPLERASSHDVIRQSLEAAAVLKARCFVMHPWPEKEFPTHSPEKKERKSNASEFISAFAAECKARGIVLALENMQPQLLISPLKDLLWIHHETEEPNIAACFDIGHAFLGSIQSALHELSGHIAIVHAHDNMGTKDDHLPPGKGIVDWSWFITELLKTGFRGPFVIELEDREDVDADSVLREAREAAGFIEGMLSEAKLSQPE